MKRAAVKNFSVWARRTLVGEIRGCSSAQHLTDTDVETIAYTWFHRLITVRILELNGQLPVKLSLFSSTDPKETLPDAVRSPFESGIFWRTGEKESLYSLIFSGDMDGIFRMLFFHLCRDLHEKFPDLFAGSSDPYEKFFASRVSDKGSVVRRLASDLPEEVFLLDEHGNADILKWIYEDYETEREQLAIADLKKKKRLNPELASALSTVCTPEWIARFLADQALTQICDEKREQSGDGKWLEEIRILDPCAGSGTTLLASFELLMDRYLREGYGADAAAACILKKNLFGCEISGRAAQICRIALVLKARSYAPNLSGDACRICICVPPQSGELTEELENFITGGDQTSKEALRSLFSGLGDAGRIGSLCRLKVDSFSALRDRLHLIEDTFYETIFEQFDQKRAKEEVEPLLQAADILSGSFDLVLAQPPMLDAACMEPGFAGALRSAYPHAGDDLGMAFLARCLELTGDEGWIAMLTEDSVFFGESFASIRGTLLKKELVLLAHMGSREGEKCGNSRHAAFLIRNHETTHHTGTYIRLTDLHTSGEQAAAMKDPGRRYERDQADFSGIPGSPCAYWLSGRMLAVFGRSRTLGDFGSFLREEADRVYECLPSFRQALKTGDAHAFRTAKEEDSLWMLGYANSRIFREWKEICSPAEAYSPEALAGIPVPDLSPEEKREAAALAAECVQLEKEDRDSFEHSADFLRHPMLNGYYETAEEAYRAWKTECHVRFVRMRENKEALNRLFLHFYERDASAEAAESEVTVHRIYDTAEEASGDMQTSPFLLTKKSAVKSLLQYAVGCMFGRYSLDTPGVVYAGGIWDGRNYRSYRPVQANCLLLPAETEAGEEILLELEHFLSVVYGRDTLAENLAFLARALEGEGDPEQVLRTYFCREFYRDHLEAFDRRPLYVLFSSGRRYGFRALSYVYRWKRDTVGQVLFEARRFRDQMQRHADRLAEHMRSQLDPGERARAIRQIDLLKKRCAEVDAFEDILREGALASREFRPDEDIRRNVARLRTDRHGRKLKLLEDV